MLAQDGIDASLAKVARIAGVGPGSLYRHFPSREDLAVAVFDEFITDLEQLGGSPDSTLDDVLAQVIDQLPTSAGFISALSPSSTSPDHPHPGLVEISMRFTELLAGKLAHADTRGTIAAATTPDQIMMAIALLAALLIKTDVSRRPAVAAQAWTLLLQGLRHPREAD